MANAPAAVRPPATATSSPSNQERTPIDVDPAILAVIKSASAPVGVPKNVVPPASLPGTLSHWRGMRILLDIMRRGVEVSLDYRAEHGDVYRMSIAGNPMVGIWDADAVHQIFRNEDRAWSAAMGWGKYMFEGLDDRRNLGGLLAVDFDEHRIARKLVSPAFTTKACDEYLVTATRHFAEANTAWVARGHVGFKAEGRGLLSRVANEIFTGIHDPKQMAIVDQALTDFWFIQFSFVKNRWLSPTFRRGKNGVTTLVEILSALVPERRASGGTDLFSRLCAVTDRDHLGDDDVVRIFVNILAAAFDTTSAGLTSMAYLLAKHPDWQDKLREEAFAIGDRPLDVAASREMKLHDLVWKETLRLMPVATFLPRRPLRAVEVGGHTLPAGTLALVATGAMGRHPGWWSAPARFDPERFSPERAEDKKHPGIYQPFGSGPHVCIGAQLATMEVKAYWHDLLRRCRFRLTKDYDARHSTSPLGTASGKVELTLEPLRR
jgi:cytochrome P450